MEISDIPFQLIYQRYNSGNNDPISTNLNLSTYTYFLNLNDYRQKLIKVEMDNSLKNYTVDVFVTATNAKILSHLSLYDESMNFLYMSVFGKISFKAKT